jgi:hypothetical protein
MHDQEDLSLFWVPGASQVTERLVGNKNSILRKSQGKKKFSVGNHNLITKQEAVKKL